MKLINKITENPVKILILLVIISSPFIWWASQLAVRADFKNLLPQKTRSVIAMNNIVDRFGGTETLNVVLKGSGPEQLIPFIEKIVPVFKENLKEDVSEIIYRISETKNFFEDNKYLYADKEDLVQIHDRLSKKIKYEKLRNNPFYFDLTGEEVTFDISDIEAKYKKKGEKYDHYTDGYFFSKDQKLALIILKPLGTSTSVDKAKELIAKVSTMIESQKPASYQPPIQFTYSGKYKETVDDYYHIIQDMISTLGLCLALVALCIFLYFYRIEHVLFLVVPLIFGALWTFGITKLSIGYLNSQTAFLGSIIVGNGVNTGIILLARYLEELRTEKIAKIAMAKAMGHTWKPTLYAALTTSAGFAALCFSSIKGISHFGVIGGIGMTLTWAATLIVLPCLMLVIAKLFNVKESKWAQKYNVWALAIKPFAKLASGSSRVMLGLAAVFTIVSIIGALNYSKDPLEYNFRNLRNKPSKAPKDWTAGIGDSVESILGESQSPVAVLLDSSEQAQEACTKIMSLEENILEENRLIEKCQSVYDFVPSDQQEKLKWLKKIKILLSDSSLGFLSADQKAEVEKFKKAVSLKEVQAEQLPSSILAPFQDKKGEVGKIVYVYPYRKVGMQDGRKLMRFSDLLSRITLSDGKEVGMSGQSAIFADLLRSIERDAPKLLVYSFIAVALLIFLNYRALFSSAYVLMSLILGVLWMVGLQSFANIKLNFFNFIAFPVTFGIGVDYSVNFLARAYESNKIQDIYQSLISSGAAILLCSATTMVSYVTLLIAMNRALISFGWLALFGEIACVVSSLVIMPAFLSWLSKKRS